MLSQTVLVSSKSWIENRAWIWHFEEIKKKVKGILDIYYNIIIVNGFTPDMVLELSSIYIRKLQMGIKIDLKKDKIIRETLLKTREANAVRKFL